LIEQIIIHQKLEIIMSDSIKLTCSNADIIIDNLKDFKKRINVKMYDNNDYCHLNECITNYNMMLIEKILNVKGPSWLCDEITRDEDKKSVFADLKYSIFSYINKENFEGKTVLDFGCGCGSSIVNLSRLLPKSNIIGVDIEEKYLEIAEMRKEFYKLDNVSLILSPATDKLPLQQKVDYILLSAVYEHLLPYERKILLFQLWSSLKSGGILFINQTPDRRFPIETHTTGLPFINYLPDKLTHLLATKLSKRINREISWNKLLRNGIRGATPNEIYHHLLSFDKNFLFLKPGYSGIHCQSDIWYSSAKMRFSSNSKILKDKIKKLLYELAIFFKISLAPYISLAFKKY
jgi:2-polyprenyl-3-methyl-5-hydroxy-6-metoxy-1,4-benzoquinol methylase